MAAPEELAIFLIAEGCLPMVAGVQPSAAPPAGTPLSASERAALGFTGAGVTMRYGAEGQDVIADFGAQTATIRLADCDVGKALSRLDAAMQRALGDTQRTEEADSTPGRKLRTYLIRLSERRYARVAVAYPDGGRAALEFRVTGMASIGYISPGAAAA